MSIHSGPPLITSESVSDHYESSPPRMLVVVFCVAGALFVGGLACGAMYLIRTRF